MFPGLKRGRANIAFFMSKLDKKHPRGAMASWAVDAGRFYSPYHGHETEELEVILHGLRDAHGTETPCIAAVDVSASSANVKL